MASGTLGYSKHTDDVPEPGRSEPALCSNRVQPIVLLIEPRQSVLFIRNWTMKRPTHWVFRYGRHNAPSYAHNFTTSSQTGSKLWRERLRRSPLGTEHSGRLKRVLVRKLPRKCDQMNSMLQCYRWDVVFFVCLWWRRART